MFEWAALLTLLVSVCLLVLGTWELPQFVYSRELRTVCLHLHWKYHLCWAPIGTYVWWDIWGAETPRHAMAQDVCDFWVGVQEFAGDFHKPNWWILQNHHLCRFERRTAWACLNIYEHLSLNKSNHLETNCFSLCEAIISSPVQHSQKLGADAQHAEPLTTDCQWQTICQCGQDRCFCTVTGDTSLLTNLSQSCCHSREQLDEIWHKLKTVVHEPWLPYAGNLQTFQQSKGMNKFSESVGIPRAPDSFIVNKVLKSWTAALGAALSEGSSSMSIG